MSIHDAAGVAVAGRRFPIPMGVQIVHWACGLRGAVAYALAVNMPHVGPSLPIPLPFHQTPFCASCGTASDGWPFVRGTAFGVSGRSAWGGLRTSMWCGASVRGGMTAACVFHPVRRRTRRGGWASRR